MSSAECYRCTIRVKKKRRIFSVSFSGTKCTKDVNIISQIEQLFTNEFQLKKVERWRLPMGETYRSNFDCFIS